MMLIGLSDTDTPFRLTNELWSHILNSHPELLGLEERLLETLREPELIKRGDHGDLLAIRFYHQSSRGPKYFIVVYRERSISDGFVITAYLTRRPAATRETLWQG